MNISVRSPGVSRCLKKKYGKYEKHDMTKTWQNKTTNWGRIVDPCQMCLCVLICACISICLSVCYCVYISLCVSVFLCLAVYVSVCLFVSLGLFVSLCVCVSVCVSLFLCVLLYVFMSVCVSNVSLCLWCVCACLNVYPYKGMLVKEWENQACFFTSKTKRDKNDTHPFPPI